MTPDLSEGKEEDMASPAESGGQMIAPKPCEVCGLPFGKPPLISPAKWAARRYCSRACVGVARRGVIKMPSRPLIDRVRARLEPDRQTGCMVWTGTVVGRGYGCVTALGGKKHYAHRVAYEAAKGPIPAGLVIDHLCRNTRCCNPDHLEAVTSGENTRRGRQS